MIRINYMHKYANWINQYKGWVWYWNLILNWAIDRYWNIEILWTFLVGLWKRLIFSVFYNICLFKNSKRFNEVIFFVLSFYSNCFQLKWYNIWVKLIQNNHEFIKKISFKSSILILILDISISILKFKIYFNQYWNIDIQSQP